MTDCGTARADDGLLAQAVAFQDAGDPPFAHHEHAVRDAQDLGQLGRDDDHRAALGREPLDQGVDLGLGADVDAAGRLVEQQDAGAGGDPAADDGLLLVAAGELADRPLDHRAGLRFISRISSLALGGEGPPAHEAEAARSGAWRRARCCCGSSGARRCRRACALPARGRGRRRSPRAGCRAARLLAFDADLARIGPVDAGDKAQQFRAACADQARDAEHLALAELEARIPHGRAARQAAHVEHDLVAGKALVFGVRQLATDHARDHGLSVVSFRTTSSTLRPSRRIVAVSQTRNTSSILCET